MPAQARRLPTGKQTAALDHRCRDVDRVDTGGRRQPPRQLTGAAAEVDHSTARGELHEEANALLRIRRTQVVVVDHCLLAEHCAVALRPSPRLRLHNRQRYAQAT